MRKGDKAIAWRHANSHEFWEQVRRGDYIFNTRTRVWQIIIELRPISRKVLVGDSIDGKRA